MSVNHSAIFKQAFDTTFRYPALWLLGLFLAGGFNANFFYLANLRWGWRDLGWAIFFRLDQNTPLLHFAVGVSAAIVLAAVFVVVANWAKIIFILRASDLLKLTRMRPAGQGQSLPEFKQYLVQDSPRFLPSVVAMSLFTVVSMSVLTTILAGGSEWLFASRGAVWSIALLLLAIFSFLFACLNVFGSFFIVFYKRKFTAALNLALDLLISRWADILITSFWLMVIYALCFFAGKAILSVIVFVPVAGLIFWLWLAIVNTFFNLSLMLLFAQLVKPLHDPEVAEAPQEAPLPEPSAS